MKWAVWSILVLFAALLLFAETDLPDRGDPAAPASVHVAARYVERSMEDTETPNVVTAVLADYRGFDTFGEAVVVFTAALCSILILANARTGEDAA